MKVAYVTPRYGKEVVGGAEYAARMLAERVVDQLGWEVEVLTSCALDASTWENHFEVGDSVVNGVRVRRFRAQQPRHAKFPELSYKVHRSPKLSAREDQERWIDYQGPFVPDLLGALSENTADVVVFYPYLYYPTVRGLPLVAKKSVMHPAAHDEVAIRMPIFASTFSQAAGFVFQTDGERRLTESLFSIADRPQLLLGLGVESQTGDVSAFRARFGLGDRPYLMCLGRVDRNKGSMLLAKYFAEYKRRNPGPLALVFSGPVVEPLEPHDDVVVTDIISDAEKWAALQGSEVVVSPSPFEAFSLALIEGWAAGSPALVNGSCLATREHVERSKGGLWFDGYFSFETALNVLLHKSEIASSMAHAGRQYVDERFRWPALIDRYGRFLQQIADRAQGSREVAA